ncbi:MAG: hypothetical protein RL111_731 [Pseudomonadota bacterium]
MNTPINLNHEVEQCFSAQGPLARQWPGYVPRDGQIHMAQAVTQQIQQGGSLVVQAGTGVGKTFAYLVPALLSRERILVSTATKALQEQLFSRDLPALLSVLGIQVQVALLKGRSSYLCVHRMEQTLHQGLLPDPTAVVMLHQVKRWSGVTRSGDVSEVPGLEEQSGLLPLVTSTRENCLGSDCDHWQSCHVNQARREAMQADVVVINHHLFFADWQVKESGVAELLPSVRVVIFDEAHQLNEVGTQFLGVSLTSSALLDLSRDLLVGGLAHAKGLASWQDLASSLQKATKDWRLSLPREPASARHRWRDDGPESVRPEEWAPPWQALDEQLSLCENALQAVAEVHPELQRLLDRAQALRATWRLFSSPCDQGVRWAETALGGQIGVHQAPLDLNQSVAGLWGDAPVVEVGDPPPKTWIFTSATLGADDQLKWFTQPCGLSHARTLKVQSPFDYPEQGVLFIPTDMVEPKDPLHSEQVAVLATSVARQLGGRTLVLTTTNRALKEIARILSEDLDQPGDPQVKSQGQHTKRQLMNWFQQGGSPEDPRGCVLVATASFWEGFDVPGDALQAVIIDKLPFAPPDDPLMQAKAEALQSQGKNPFIELHLPDVAVSLQQGAGRLIRTQSDKGVLVICDRRLASANYGKSLLASLPPMRRVLTRAQLEQAMLELGLTKSCTRA